MTPDAPPTVGGPQRVAALDGLRGIAILWVLLHQLVVVPAESTFERAIFWPASFGWIGVSLFFVLSGYLITGVLLDTRDALNRVSSFYARRALRILPLYFVLVATVFSASWLVGGAWRVDQLSGWQAASFWLLLGNWSQAAAGNFLVGPLAVTWSVAIEEQFYLVWPWIVWSLSPRTLARLSGLVVIAVLIARLVGQADGANPVMLYASTWTRLDALAIGSLAAVAVRAGLNASAWRGVLWAVLIVAGTAAGVMDLAGTLNEKLIGEAGLYFCPASSLGYGITLGAIAAGALLLLVSDPAIAPRLSRLLETRWLRSLGLYSYGIYLTHGPIRAAIRDHLYGPAFDGATPLFEFPIIAGSSAPALLLYMAVCLPICWLAGLLSYRLIERPCLRLKQHFPTETSP